MELKSVRIQNYRSIDDSGDVPVGDVTCLVGKNEAGKTAFLQALHLLNPLNPIEGKKQFNDVMDFPSKRFSAYKKVREDEPATVVSAVFELSDLEFARIELALGKGVLKSREVEVSKGYGSTTYYSTKNDTKVAIAHLTAKIEGAAADKKTVQSATTIKDLVAALKAVEEPHSSVTELLAKVDVWRDHSLSHHLIDAYLGK